MEERPVKYGLLFSSLFIAILAISSSAILVKETRAPAAIIATYRLLFTVLILIIPTIIYHRDELLHVKKYPLISSIISGLFLALHFVTWFESLSYTSIASSVVLVTMQPIFSLIGGILFFKERYSVIAILGSVIAVIGGIIIGWGDLRIGGLALWGDILALLGAVFSTIYWLIGQSVRSKLSLLPYALIVYGSAAIMIIIYDLFLSYSFFSYSKRDWMIFILIAIIPNILGHTIFNWSMKYIRATTVSMLILGEPIGSNILAYFMYHDILSITQWVGSFFILFGTYLYLRNPVDQKMEKKSF
ncbi:DMT family transporter [Tepidibacillus sp. LV47]|uniref:DMT family transporter n=1 Tax=Tepidibacillus sp. LV47 TaxID=3398228 RepID=UPI003AAAEF9D